MDKKIERFYLSILDYAGLKYNHNEHKIENKNEEYGEFKVNGKYVALPYDEVLRNLSLEREIFHPLRENYLDPETNLMLIYRKRLELEINTKLCTLITNLITAASNPEKIKNPDLVHILADIKSVNMQSLENFLKIIKKSIEEREEHYIYDTYIKRTGEIKGVLYACIGKIDFSLYKDIVKSLNDQSYSLYNVKLRKMDLLCYSSLFESIFPNISDEDLYSVGVDNKLFRYLETLLLLNRLVSSRINEVSLMLKNVEIEDLDYEFSISDHTWYDLLNDIRDMEREIKLIPSIINPNEVKTNIKKYQEQILNQSSNPPFNKQDKVEQHGQLVNPPPIHSVTNQQQQPLPQKEIGPEDVIRQQLQQSQFYPNYMQPYPYQQGYQQPPPIPPNPPFPPPQYPPQYPPYQQPYPYPPYPQQQFYNPYVQQPMGYQAYPTQQVPINPHFIGSNKFQG